VNEIAYVNGQFVAKADAQVNIEDRGYQFGDGAYEVCTIANGQLLDAQPHVKRLERSLRELRIAMPDLNIEQLCLETAQQNHVEWGIVYIQVSRGVAPRNHAFPDKSVLPAVVITSRSMSYPDVFARGEKGVAVISTPEIRWRRCDIKSIALLPNIMAKQEARDVGAFEAWFVNEDGFVTEGSSTNAWIIRDDTVITHPVTNAILNGITRQVVIRLLEKEGLQLKLRPFTLDEVKQADGAFMTSTTVCVTAVTSIDGVDIADGKVDDRILTIAARYKEHVHSAAG
jgi:D-alanine transaminase